MAIQVDAAHLSRKESAPDTSGNLYESNTDDQYTVSGGWGGQRRARRRKIIGVGLAAGSIGLGAAAVQRIASDIAAKKALKKAGMKGTKIVK